MKFFLLLLFGGLVFTASAQVDDKQQPSMSERQRSMVGAFIEMPESLTPYIPLSVRVDMVDFYEAGNSSISNNLFLGESSIDLIEDYSIVINLASDKSVLCIRKLYTQKNDSIFAIIETVSTPEPDSSIKFFDSKWNPLDYNSLFKFPKAEDFIVGKKSKETESVAAKINIELIELRFTPEGNIVAKLSTDFLPDQIREEIDPFINREGILYTWNGKKFVDK